jgi:hypothetical protein
MDTTTVLEIIKMIDVKTKNIRNNYSDESARRTIGLYELKEQLQSFIEAELNAAENQTGE